MIDALIEGMRYSKRSCGIAIMLVLVSAGASRADLPVADSASLIDGERAETAFERGDRGESAIINVPSDTVSLSYLLDVASEGNREIRAAEAALAAALHRPRQARSLPDPMVTASVRNVSFDDFTLGDQMMSMAGLSFQQMIPNYSLREARGRTAEEEARRLAFIIEATRLRVTREVSELYHDLYETDRSIEVITENREILRTLLGAAEARYATGGGIQQDVLKAQVEISGLTDRLIRLARRRRGLVARMNGLLDRPAATPIGTPAESPVWEFDEDPSSISAEALESNPLLEAYRAAQDREEANLSRARAEYGPNWMIGGGVFTRDNLDEIWDLRFGLSIPLWARDRQAEGVAEAEERVRRSEEEREMMEARIDARVHDLDAAAVSARERVLLFETGLVEEANLSLRSSIAGYEVGSVDFLTVIDNLLTLQNFELEVERQRAEFGKAVAGIEELLGRPMIPPRGSAETLMERPEDEE